MAFRSLVARVVPKCPAVTLRGSAALLTMTGAKTMNQLQGPEGDFPARFAIQFLAPLVSLNRASHVSSGTAFFM